MKKKILTILIISIICVLSFTVPVFAGDEMVKLNEGGLKILNVVRAIAYWIILFKMIADLVRCGMSGDTSGLGKIIMTYVLIYSALFFTPWFLRLVEGIFS